MNKDILIAIDGSMYAEQAISYITLLLANDTEANFHLCTWVSASKSIMPSTADSKNSLIPNSGNDAKKEAAIKHLDRAERLLSSAGIEKSRFHSSVTVAGYDIASAINHTASAELPDSIVLGRRGVSGISELLMGSVSTELFKKCHSTPLWIVDGKISHKDFLVPVDGSLNSLLAIDHLCHMLAGRTDIRIFLFHCTLLFGKEVICNPSSFYEYWDREWCDRELSGDKCLFNGPERLLLDAGIPKNNIIILPAHSDLEESHGIIRQAKKHNCGTVVIGRRKSGITKGLLGGVSDRTIKRVQNLALWVVG